MAKRFQLHIPVPCHENWDRMTKTAQGRHCASCQKLVIDFSKMTDGEVIHFFQNASGQSVCGRLMDDQVGRYFQPSKKPSAWTMHLLRLAIPTFLAACESRLHGKIQSVIKKEPAILHQVVSVEHTTVGFIMPEQDTAPHLQAAQRKARKRPVAMSTPAEVEQPRAMQPGAVGAAYPPPAEVKITPALTGIVGGISVRKTTGICPSPKKLMQMIFPTSRPSYGVFPNPIARGASLHIEWNDRKTGRYRVELFNGTGRLIFFRELEMTTGNGSWTLELPAVAAGFYFLKITSASPDSSYTQKLIVGG